MMAGCPMAARGMTKEGVFARGTGEAGLLVLIVDRPGAGGQLLLFEEFEIYLRVV